MRIVLQMHVMSAWPSISFKGQILDLSHLEPFEFQCFPRGFTEQVTVSVRFNDHCFTKKFDPKYHLAEEILPSRIVLRSESRVFCDIRYGLSFHLREFIESLGTKRIASTREGNLVRVETPDGQFYAIFFTLRRHNARRAEMFVISAYPLDQGRCPADTGEMKFDLALAKILRGEKAKFPRR